MPPALDRAPRRRRPRSRPTTQGLLAAARTAPARPLSTAARPPRVTNVRHAAVRASHFIPGVSDARQPKPLQAQPPKRPLGAQPGGKARGVTTRKARSRELTRIARQIATPDPPQTQKREHSFLHNLLSAGSPVGQSVREGRINPVDVFSTVAGRVGANVLRVVAEDPGKQLPKLLKDTGESIVSIPAGVVRTATNPVGAAKGVVSDYDRRYKSLLEGDDKTFRARLKKEGVAPEVFDIAAVATAEGGIAGRALQKAAEAGTLGETAARVATTRPGLRVSGGLVKPQPVSDNFFRNVVRAGVDTARKDVQARRGSAREASALVREAESAGQVTPIFRTEGIQRRSVAQAKGRQLQSMKAEQQAQVGSSTQAIASLSKPEQRAFKYAVQYGAVTPETARQVLTAHKERVASNRLVHAAQTGESIPPRQNELPEIDYLLGHTREAFTPRLAEVARQERARGVAAAALDPGIDLDQAELRRTAPLAELLKVERNYAETPPEFRKRKRELQRIIKRDTGAAQRSLETARRHEARERGRTELRVSDADRKLLRNDKPYRTAATALGRAQREFRDARIAHGNAHRNSDLWSAEERRAIEQRAATAERDLRTARETFKQVRADAEKRLAKDLGRAPARSLARLERSRSRVLEAEQTVARGKELLARTKDLKPRPGEATNDFLRRIREAGQRAGVEEPGYFPSEKRGEGVFSAFAVGGRQAVAGAKEYTGALTRTGRESTALDVLPRGIARNIKRKYNWNLVADNFDRHAYSWSKGKTIEQLKDEMERRGIDPRSVAFWNPKKFRDEQQAAARLEGPDVEAGSVTPETADAHTAAQLATNPAAFKDSPGWSLIPKGVHDEIMTDIRPSGALGRGFDIAKGKVFRVLLGNPAWLQFQVAANAFLTGLTGTGPVDAVKAQVWWRKLPEAQKQAMESHLGIRRWYDDQTHLGATANNRIVNAYRAFKQTGLYQAAHKANPLDALFRADNAQNNFFRKAVFYNKAKRETYKRMGQEAGRIITLQERAARVLSLPPKDRMDAIVRDADTFERLAEHTQKFMGDYTTYTAKERRTLGRSVMFYGFLRYSLKFTLYTMPIEHPLVSALLTQVGRLERDEQKKIFGADVPPWELGNLYTKDGRKYALARLNPFFNAVQYGEPGSLTASLSPLVQATLNQVASKDVTLDKPFTVEGSGQYVEKGSEIGHPATALIPGTIRNRIAVEQLLRLSPYYRLAEKTGIPGVAAPLRGKQTSESGLLFPDPVKYKMTTKQSREAAARNEQTKRDQASGGPARQLQEQLLPLLGQQGQDTIRKSREFDKAKQQKKRKKKKPGPPDLLGGGPSVKLPDLLGP